MRIGVLFNNPPATSREVVDHLAVQEDLATVIEVERSLVELGHATERFPVTDDIEDLIIRLRAFRPDLVFNQCETFRRENLAQINIPALLDLLNLRYTGAGPNGLGLTTDKGLCKAVLSSIGIPVPRYQVTYSGEDSDLDFEFPVIVKPLYEGGSYGITVASVVDSREDLIERVCHVAETYWQASIIEQYVDGREISAAVLGNGSPIVLPLCEYEFRAFPPTLPRIYTFDAKWTEESFDYQHTVLVCPADIPAEVAATIEQLAIRAHHTLECRDYSRVDFRLGPGGQPYVIDVNANPAIFPDADYTRALLASGRSFIDLVAALVEFAVARGYRSSASA